jgi:hypothetical protein
MSDFVGKANVKRSVHNLTTKIAASEPRLPGRVWDQPGELLDCL